MLPGVVPFPPDFAARYRAKGYWQDRSLKQEFAAVFEKFADRVAVIDGERHFTYRDVDRLSDNLALNLLELGLKPLDRVVLKDPEKVDANDDGIPLKMDMAPVVESQAETPAQDNQK